MEKNSVNPFRDQASSLRVLAKKKQEQRIAEFHHSINTQNKPLLWSFASGKGGVGKSSLCLNLGILLASLGKRILLLDADLGLSNLHILSGERPHRLLNHTLKKGGSLREIIHPTKWGVDLISSGSGLKEMLNISDFEKKMFLEELAEFQEYAIVLIDLGAGISDDVLAFLELSQRLFLIATPEPSAMADAYGLLKVLSARNASITFHLLMNRVYSIQEGKNMANRMITLSKNKLKEVLLYSGSILKDEHLVKASYCNIPLVKKYQNAPATLCLNQITRYLLKLSQLPKLTPISN